MVGLPDSSIVTMNTDEILNYEVLFKKNIVVVVPAYNEEQVIVSTIKTLLGRGYHIIVVDDGSKDGTWSKVKNLPVFLLRHPINLGQGAALQTGMTFALEMGADIIIHFDSDGQHDANEIEEMIKSLIENRADIVLGSRFLRDEDLREVPLIRRILLKGATLVNGVLTGLWLSDAHNGFRALTRNSAKKIYLKENGFSHASEILFQIKKLGLQFVENPTNIKYSVYSQKKGQSSLNAIHILLDLVIRKFFS